MGSSPSNQKKSHVTLSSSTADVVPADVQDARTLPHVTRSNGAFSTQLGSHVNMGDDTIVTVTRLSDSQQRMVRICLGELETDLEITLNCGKLMNCIKVWTTVLNITTSYRLLLEGGDAGSRDDFVITRHTTR